MRDVPAIVRARAEAVGALVWLDGLDALIGDLERDWSISVGHPYGDATEAFVADAVLDDGTPAVVKLLVPRDDAAARHEAAVLERCAGAGCVALLRGDVGRGALLLERLGRSLFALGLPVERRHAILCDTVRRVWQPTRGLELPTGAEKARMLADWIEIRWEDLGRPCSRAAVDHALRCAA